MEHLHGIYSFPLVVLSVVISILSSYSALTLYQRVLTLSGKEKTVWTVCGSIAMGLGIWSMHFIGMLAFHLPVQVTYDYVLVGISQLIPIGAAWAALTVIARSSVSKLRLALGGIFMALGIVGMHYTGMAAMRLPGTISYRWPLVALSVLIAFLVSFAALSTLSLYRRRRWNYPLSAKVGAAALLGMAIAGMHYTGMMAAEFHTYAEVSNPDNVQVGIGAMLLAGLLGAATMFILLLILVSQFMDRRYALRLADYNQSRYDSIFEHNPHMVCLFDLKGRLVRTNPAAEQITGYSRDSFLSKPFTNFLTRRDVSKVRRCITQVLQGIPQTVECTIRHRNGQPIHLSTTIVPMIADGKIVDYYAISKDVTEQKQAERQLLLAKLEAERAARAKAEFLAVMSHEIRTPLNGVIGMSELLLETELREEQRDYVRIIGTSGKALLSVINDVLDYSKIDSGKMQLQTEPFALRECLDETIHLFMPQLQERRLECRGHVDASVPSVLIGDAGRLRQVFINLIGNAVKFTERGSIEVTIRCLQQKGDQLTIECAVKDSGIGIPQHFIPFLFQPFHQLDSKMTRKYEGTGLGLAISKRLVEMMGGTIRVDSAEGLGTTFTFTVQAAYCRDELAVHS
ncbi:MHYT domain-containing protein [Paenibacillus allorhizosphaerae]|uniref:histidine kinase n=1 Tax=Paenibacillus allorhizosphaerae TaxID=2849866 RepID=A0ABM8VTD7_9BACL|nr:MHYT domain-containing protein [Paenibacillus allorhizosphaerae]CAG7657442.1 Sensor histidine kinase RcsC [Paenibacillus allorhizosphaerae]